VSKTLKPHKIWFELSWALDPNYAAYWKAKADGWRVEWTSSATAPTSP